MTSTHWPVYSDLAKEHYGKGTEEGAIRNQRDALLTLADKRGLALTDKQRALIDDTADLGRLKEWFEAAITADTPDDIFKLSAPRLSRRPTRPASGSRQTTAPKRIVSWRSTCRADGTPATDPVGPAVSTATGTP